MNQQKLVGVINTCRGDSVPSIRVLDDPRLKIKLKIVEIAELKNELDRLPPAERRKLTAYLVTKDRMLDPEFRRELTRKIDDNSPERWLTLDEVEKRLIE